MNALPRRTFLLALAPASALRGQTDAEHWLNELSTAGQTLLGEPPDPSVIRKRSVARLVKLFDGFLQSPQDYAKRAIAECDTYPEGRNFPFLLPAMAYANLAFSGEMAREAALNRMRWMVDLAIPIAADVLKAPKRDLLQLNTTAQQTTFLASLNMALACHERLGGGPRYAKLHDRLTGLLRDALTNSKGRPIHSTPPKAWTFDTHLALLSLRLWEEARGKTASSAWLDAFLAWVRKEGSDTRTGLPRAPKNSPPRGSDVAWQICLLAHLRPAEAKRLYDLFAMAHWKDLPLLAGFTEWPKDTPANAVGNLDPGPVLFDIGALASALGLGAAIATRDTARRDRLLTQLETAQPLLRRAAEHAGGVKMDDHYLTGTLYGDAVLFYALTWTRLPPVEGR